MIRHVLTSGPSSSAGSSLFAATAAFCPILRHPGLDRSRSAHRARKAVAFLLVTLIGAGCGGPAEPEAATLTLSITPTSATVEQGASTDVEFTATTGGGFSGTVTVAVSGQPAGVTSATRGLSTTGNTTTGTVAIAVSAAVATGVYPVTVTVTGSGVSATATFTLTVADAPAYELALPDPIVSVFQNGSTDVEVDILRTNFTGAVAFEIEGSAPDVGVAFTPSPATGATVTMTVDAAATTPAGDYTLTLRGTTATLPDVTTEFTLRVFEAGGTLLALDFGACAPENRPIWLAYQGATGAWVTVTSEDDSYVLTSVGDRIGLTYVTEPTAGNYSVEVHHLTTAEATSSSLCADDPASLKTVNGTTANVVGGTSLSLGAANTSAFADGPFSIDGVASGALDFIGYSVHATGGADRIVILRDQDIADGGAMGTVDFTADGVDAIDATISLSGLSGGETLSALVSYATDPGGAGVCSVAPLYNVAATNPFVAGGVPASEQEAGDAHVVTVFATEADQTLIAEHTLAALADATVAFGPELPAPTIVDDTGTGGYLRLRPDVTIPVEYDGHHAFTYASGNSTLLVRATIAALAAGGALEAPDLSASDGWDDAWAPATGGSAQWTLLAVSGGAPNARCTDGSSGISASLSGNS